MFIIKSRRGAKIKQITGPRPLLRPVAKYAR
jgi:hypothetical protein